MFARPIISFTKELVSRRLFFELGMLTFFLVNVCLLSGEGFQSPINAKVLAHLIPFLQSLRGEFVVVDDFNEDFSVIATTNIDQEVRGHWIQSGASTCAGGGDLDYGILSKGLAAGVRLSVDWITPFAPHQDAS